MSIMPGNSNNRSHSLWNHRVAAPARIKDHIILGIFLIAGMITILRLADWWFRRDHISEPILYIILSLAFWFSVGRVVIGWINYQAIKKPVFTPALEGLRVAIFTTSAPGEPLSMIEKTLDACSRIRYPHTTYLLDGTGDLQFHQAADRLGAVWLDSIGLPGAKAGKINNALKLTNEEFVLVLDPDHIPFPEFLDRVLGYFRDEEVGFVQVSQAYYNQSRSFVARAAAEQTYNFYGPILMGMSGHGTSLVIGANCTFRRKALESIGGHGVGLAEDLMTAIRLHGAGWRSVYAPEIVSRGLVPEDLGSFYKQQLKWARGVFELLFTEIPKLFFRLTIQQQFLYITISTYYLFGFTSLIYLLTPYIYLWTGLQPVVMRIDNFLVVGAPVAIMGGAAYIFAQRWLCYPEMERGLHWRGFLLKVACWPVYLQGFILALLRAKIPYIPTSKEAVKGRFFHLTWPHLIVLVIYVVTLIKVIYMRLIITPEESLMLTTEAVWGMVGFATLFILMNSGAFYAAWASRKPPEGHPWSSVKFPVGGESGT